MKSNQPQFTDRYFQSSQESIATAVAMIDHPRITDMLPKIDPKLMDAPYDDIVTCCLEHRRQYGRAPGKGHIDDVLAHVFDDKQHKLYNQYKSIISRMVQQADRINPNYVADGVEEFAARRTARTLIAEMVERYQKGDERVLDDLLPYFSLEKQQQIGRASQRGLMTTQMRDVKMEPIAWLWSKFLPFGKLTIIAGMPKMGKSVLTLSFVAAATGGAAWPDGRKRRDPVKALICSLEDDAADTIVPRLTAMGADPDRVELISGVAARTGGVRVFSLKHNIADLKRKLQQDGDIGLIVVDPVADFTGGKTDTNVETQVREMLAPLRDLAAEHQVAILAVMHFKKGAEEATLHQVGGSNAYTAVARSIFACLPDKNDPNRRLFLSAGTNLSKGDCGYAYHIEGDWIETPEGRGIETQKIVWEESVDGTADDHRGGEGEDSSPKIDAAEVFLRGLLDGGDWRAASDIEDAALSAGIKTSALKRTRTAMVKHRKLETEKKGLGGWSWRLIG